MQAKIVYEDNNVVAFEDINPQAPVHVLVVPKVHVEKISDLTESNKNIVADMVMAANKIAKKTNVSEGGYRTVINCGPDAGQAVSHIHLHLLGGRKLSWPPG